MSDSNWERLQQLFHQAIALAPKARLAFAKEQCGNDEALLNKLLRLINSHDAGTRLGDIVRDAASESVDDVAPLSEDHWIGKTVGAWKIVKRIGAGGMGAVFLADRVDQQFQQSVAIKVMSAQLLASDAVARFKSERQILANLNHRYIAQLHDGGTTDDGLPYLVMEYVDGHPIDQYCDQQKLSIEGRLRLFQKVCEAVDYAHRNLIVHRDLKPSNILIDSQGDPKLLDFGIAKLLDTSTMDMTVAVTQHGARAMTPEYASPEQVRGELISVATDVYSLGVLLYRLMTGQSPYGTSMTSPLDYERAIIEYQPDRPSTIVTSAADQKTGGATEQDAASISDARQTKSLGKLRKLLLGDLDNIVLTAMQKEPARRYATAQQLSDDIANYLDNRPVLARRDSLGYRAGKFLRRNIAEVAVTVGAMIIVTGLVSFYTWQLGQERDRALLAERQARTESRIATRVTDFVVSLFNAANPERGGTESKTPQDLLDEGAARIDTELAGVPKVRVKLLSVLSEAYRVMGAYEQSQPLADEALRIRLDLFGAESAQVAEAKALTAHNLMDRGDLAAARALYEEAMPIMRADPSIERRSLGAVLNQYGWVLKVLGESELALQAHQEVVDLAEADPEFPPRALGDAHGNLGILMASRNQYEEALDHYERARVMFAQVGPGAELSMSKLLVSTANTEFNLGAYAQALEHMNEALELSVRLLGPDHQQVGSTHLARSQILDQLGRTDEGKQDILRSLEVLQATLGPTHPRIGIGQHYLGTHYWQMEGDLELAAGAYREALRIYRTTLKSDHSNIIFALNALGTVERERGNLAAAEANLSQALSYGEGSLASGHSEIGRSHRELARVHYAQGHHERAKAAFEKAYATSVRVGSHQGGFVELLEDYADFAEAVGDHDRATSLRGELQTLSAGATK